MMVTKRQQLKWLASKIVKWPADGAKISVSIDDAGNPKFYMPWDAFAPWDVMRVDFTREEWRQERDKMQNEKSVITGGIYLSRNGFRFEVVDIAKVGSDCSIDMVVYMNLDATNDFPPGQKWVLELETFISKFKLYGGGKPAPDNSWHERGELPPVGTICEMIDDRATWYECKIIAHEDGACIGWIESRKAPFYTYDMEEFRPLRTEREKAIEQMVKLIGHGYMSAEMAKELVIKMHDSGYHK